ncbi:MAG: acyltransferase family protein [Oscillatoriales cyanobacterium C42_A2020_001]|nr:acyltransferase family protein [Leptolyngbyaceae cyanobacterium C42_A2020_001]
MKEQQRLVGIDLFRGFAIYAVILLHIDEGVQNVPAAWSKITDFSLFAVPFFLATAFYFAINKLYQSKEPYPLRQRLLRLLIPYGFWSIFYLVYKSAKYVAGGDSAKLAEIFQDPLSIIFFGGAAFHLYFLPLLATGTLLIRVVENLITRKVSLRGLGILALVSVLLYEAVLLSGDGLKTPENIAFESLLTAVFPTGNSIPLVRLILVVLFWALKCLPYVMLAAVLTHPTFNQRFLKLVGRYALLGIIVFVILNGFGSFVLPPAIYEVARGYTALIAAIAFSFLLKENALIRNLGLCSFGIYLIHLLFVEVFQSVFVRLNPNYVNDPSIVVFLLASMVILVLSWGITALLMKRKMLSRLLFGF